MFGFKSKQRQWKPDQVVEVAFGFERGSHLLQDGPQHLFACGFSAKSC